MNLEEAGKLAEAHAAEGRERELAALRAQWDDEIEAVARDADYRLRVLGYRSIALFRFRAKLELLRRGLDDESPAVRGAALISLETLSRDHPGDVNGFRPLLNEIAARDPNQAVRRLAIFCFKNGTPQADTIRILDGIAADDEQDREVRDSARKVALLLTKKQNLKR
ncbi:MAG: HEAT repeat domain-containing protein [Actinobacteria bacterium]|nr:HEAT repeat domain-containing protein [Actinomycetota bacterium]